MGKIVSVKNENGYISFKLKSAYGVHTHKLDIEDFQTYKDYPIVPTRNCEKIYATTRLPGDKRYKKLHRLIMGAVNRDVLVDHINGDTLDNRRSNLRFATASENNRNSKGHRDRQSAYKGVYKTGDGRWKVEGKMNHKYFYLGYFSSQEEAAVAYNEYLDSTNSVCPRNVIK